MSKKDKRIKGCPNQYCDRHKAKHKYKAEESFCSLCGTRLVFVCAECFCEIEDTEDKRRYCLRCEAEKFQDGGKVGHAFKEAGRKTKEKAEAGANFVGDAAVKGALAIKDNAPKIKEDIKEIVNNPKAQFVALEVAEIAKDGIKNKKAKKMADAVIKAAKK